MKGGGFSISNLGMFGVSQFSAIINPPQGAILAVGGSQKRVVKKSHSAPAHRQKKDQWVEESFMSLTLSCDHRAINGAQAAQFLSTLQTLIERPLKLVF